MWPLLLASVSAASTIEWPAVPIPAPTGGGEQDAAVIAGDGPDALDWYVWLTVGHGVPPERVTLLQGATPDEVLAAAGAASPADGGTAWFVLLGPHGPPLTAVKQALTDDHPRVLIADAPDLPGAYASAPAGTTILTGPGKLLAGTDRRALSYLALGGLRGWADTDGDGQITALEVATWSALAFAAVDPLRRVSLPGLLGDGEVVLARGREPAPDLGLSGTIQIELLHILLSNNVEIRECFIPVFGLLQLVSPRREPSRSQVTVHISIPRDGVATEVSVLEPRWKGSELERCLGDAVRAIQFPPTTGQGTSLTYPFVLQ
jgi:hypothetical protein